MMRLRFLLALPILDRPAETVTIAPTVADVRSNAPALWRHELTPLIPFAGCGFVLGIVFSRATGRRVEAIDAHPVPLESAQAARFLVSNYWGTYCAVLSCKSNQQFAVMCDPSGLLPVYRLSMPGHVLIGTDVEDFWPAGTENPTIDFEAVRGHLLRPDLRQRRTCLTGLDELAPGVLVSPNVASDRGRPMWRAADFLPRPPAPNFSDAANQLHELAISIHQSWSTVFGKVTVATSGGVDSSFICAALAGACVDFDCVTVTTLDRSGDERVYARSIADAFGARCVERLYDPNLLDPRRSSSTGLPRPARRAFLQALDSVLVDGMDELGASVVFDGNGGDNLFCFLHSSAPILDRMLAEGLNRGVFATLFDMCRITDCSLPVMTRALVRRMAQTSGYAPWPVNAALLSARKGDAHADPLTPWIDGRSRRTGKQDHVALIMHAQNHVHGLTTGLPRFSPLLSQPLVEFCLGIPTWIWTEGGINRALARAAFKDDLPASTIVRTSKSGPDSFIRRAFAMNRALIGERLLDGTLAQHGLLDRTRISQALQVDEVADEIVIDRLLDLLEAENWCRSWGG